MVAPRQFNGGRSSNGGRMGAASEMMRLEITKKGKLPAAERYKRIVAKKMEENKQKALGAAYKKPFSLSGKMQIGKMGARAEQALKEIALKKARKLAKDERKMVIVEARNFHNGHITKKGEIYDIAGNVIGKVNTKNGSIVSNTGWGIGKYKPKSMFTNTVITDAINKYSPYYINLRRQQMLEQQMAMAQMGGVYGAMTPDVINVHGQVNTPGATSAYGYNPHGYTQEEIEHHARYGADLVGTRQNVGVTAWGVRSDNVHGTFNDNVWGGTGDNVWGGYSTDVWGGTGGQSMWGQKGYRLWGTGSGTNFLKPITNAIVGLFSRIFGITSRKNREALRQMNALANAYRNSANAQAGRGAPSQSGRRR
ncbi:MAG: hypothetical protein LW823_06165 [Rickettsiales bacterium]|jgi:hypothetical protein|nr:hypothetical protein [Rickettsiales bacterium]